MIETNIRDYKGDTIALYDRIKNQLSEPEYNNLLSDIDKSINKTSPSMMFYGIYNAGKSSLLNAIFGDEVASVDDIPETHNVTEYKWKNFILVDTPGLNGPKEDEEVSLNEVNRHDIIMFVIDDSDNFDSEEITKRIVEIIEIKKPCLIVINRKNGSDNEKISNIRLKMKQNISKLTKADQYYEFISVDAMSALNAKKHDKNLLLEDSNIRELEYRISERLKNAQGVSQLLVPLNQMKEICNRGIESCDIYKENSELESLTKLQKKIFYTKDNICQEFKIEINNILNNYGNQIFNSASVNANYEFDKGKCESEIASLANRCFEKFSSECNQKVSEFKASWKLELNLLSIPDKPRLNVKSGNSDEKDEIDELFDILEKIPIIIKLAPIPVPIPLPIIVAAAKAFKRLIFGDSKKTVDVDEINQQQEEYAQKRSLALKELRNQIDIQMNDYSRAVTNSFNEQIDAAYQNYKSAIEESISKNGEESAAISAKRNELLEIESEVNDLIGEIS